MVNLSFGTEADVEPLFLKLIHFFGAGNSPKDCIFAVSQIAEQYGIPDATVFIEIFRSGNLTGIFAASYGASCCGSILSLILFCIRWALTVVRCMRVAAIIQGHQHEIAWFPILRRRNGPVARLARQCRSIRHQAGEAPHVCLILHGMKRCVIGRNFFRREKGIATHDEPADSHAGIGIVPDATVEKPFPARHSASHVLWRLHLGRSRIRGDFRLCRSGRNAGVSRRLGNLRAGPV
jgi:hypothetical protein